MIQAEMLKSLSNYSDIWISSLISVNIVHLYFHKQYK